MQHSITASPFLPSLRRYLSFSMLVFFVWLAQIQPIHAAKEYEIEIQAFPSILHADGTWLIEGRTMRKSRWIGGDAKPSALRNMMGMVRRFTRKGAARARITLVLGSQNFTTDADAKGYFRFQGKAPTSLPSQAPQETTSAPSACQRPRWNADPSHPFSATPGILPFSLTVETEHNGSGKRYKAPPYHGFLVYRNANQGIHVISDLDDTLIWTHVTQKTKLAKQALFDDVRKVKTIDGALSFLETLLCSPNNQGGGTLHYLSGSPTRLFDRILRIFRLHHFPLGSLTLRPLSNAKAASQSQQSLYKVIEIRRILRTYPQESFVLVGDNGEKDPIIYNLIRNEFPKQIRAILIHQVKPLTLEQQALSNTFYFKDYNNATRYIAQHLRQ